MKELEPPAIVRSAEESESQLVARCKKAMKQSDKSSWEVADCWAQLSDYGFGWKQERIAEEFGVSRSTVSKFISCVENCSLANNRPPFWEEFQKVDGKTNAAHVSHNSGDNEWYTPDEYLDAARQVLGTIELDPASSEIAQQRVMAETYYTKEDDGLSKDWKGKVWMNPPYAPELVKLFMAKICLHIEAGDVPEAIVLVNNATETEWFQGTAHLAKAICFPSGRVKFLDEDGNPGAPLQGQAILYFGKNIKSFVGNFGAFGFCLMTRA